MEAGAPLQGIPMAHTELHGSHTLLKVLLHSKLCLVLLP